MSKADGFHRVALALVKAGAVEDQRAAMIVFERLKLHIAVSKEPLTPARCFAIESIARCAVRSFGGNVTYDGPNLPDLGSLGVIAGARESPTIGIGDVEADSWLMVDGLRGGVVSRREDARLDGWFPAIAVAAACAVGMMFQRTLWSLKLYDRKGQRLGDPRINCNGVDLLSPGDQWLAAQPRGLPSRLPSEAWVLGCGNLGQAFLYSFATLPFSKRTAVNLVLQDIDRANIANASTSVLTDSSDSGKWKTRLCAQWLNDKGFEPRIIEQRFGALTRRAEDDPAFLFCGVDNLLSRQSLDDGGFATVIDAGLGAESQDLTTFRLRALPGPTPARQLYAARARRPGDAEFYRTTKDFQENALADLCGAQLIADTAVGIPFVGVVTAALAVGQLLARANGLPALSAIAGDVRDLGKLQTAAGTTLGRLSLQLPAEA